ncbi:D-alanyl-D-alanine carboxypeptidase [Actinospica acidiphila]|uniref:D-alanyl-D-alanine carboxypeptidase n=1 Tax=Actinospica acidiphila TaxID=304899 RepID=A0A9X5CKQ5_9ACTN|nr:D-alanyl-D-alanine carboxypeptidase [Actinospica acidiphila]NEC50235.1 D-alanyl-D-alanine carboxypeptidase [Actinospica acidiphila]
MWTAAGALLLLAALTALVALPRSDRDTSARQDGALTEIVADDIPWPGEGQAAVTLEGSGQVLTHGAQRPVPIASLTKVMTAYVVLDGHPLRPGEEGPRIKVDPRAAHEAGVGGESTVVVTPGDRRTERELLHLLLLPSANNIARLLARWDAGSEEAFVRKMQRAAHDLGMRDTTYTDASGISPTTTSTAADQLKLAREAMRLPVLRDIVATREATVPGVGRVANSNTLLGTSGVVGLKTGSSTPAGGNLLWAARTDGTRLLLGAVLHQRANTTPAEGLTAALEASRILIDGLRARPRSTGSEG